MIAINPYIPFDSGTATIDQAFLNSKRDGHKFDKLEQLNNSHDRISEMLINQHVKLNRESEVAHA